MRFFLAGGAGEIGRYLTEYYLQAGHEVVVYDPLADSLAEAYPGLTLVKGDLRDRELLATIVQKNDIVVNLAWSFAENAAILFGNDLVGHINLLEVAAAAGVQHFVYTSAAVVYGTPLVDLITEEHPCLLDKARKPLYAVAKFAAEQLCYVYRRERGLPVTVLRFWWAFGKTIGGKHLKNIIHAAVNNEPITIMSGAGGCFVSMEDLAAAISSLVKKEDTSNVIYNIGSLFLTWSEIVEFIIKITGSQSPVITMSGDEWEGPAFLREKWRLSWEKANQEIGYTPRRSEKELRAAFCWALSRLALLYKKV